MSDTDVRERFPLPGAGGLPGAVAGYKYNQAFNAPRGWFQTGSNEFNPADLQAQGYSDPEVFNIMRFGSAPGAAPTRTRSLDPEGGYSQSKSNFQEAMDLWTAENDNYEMAQKLLQGGPGSQGALDWNAAPSGWNKYAPDLITAITMLGGGAVIGGGIAAGAGAEGATGAGLAGAEGTGALGGYEAAGLGEMGVDTLASYGGEAYGTDAGVQGIGAEVFGEVPSQYGMGEGLASEQGFVPGSFELGEGAGLPPPGQTGGGLSWPDWTKEGLTIPGTDFRVPNNVLGGVGQAALGYLGAGKQSDAYRDVSSQNLALGAPSRQRFDASFAPGFDLFQQPGYGESLDRVADISARRYSSRMGNPADSPTAQAGIFRDVLNEGYLPMLTNYRAQNLQGGGMGLPGAQAAQLSGAGAAGGGYNALGYGLGTIMNPQPDWGDIFKRMGTGEYPVTAGSRV